MEIKFWKGKTREQKKKIVEELTNAFTKLGWEKSDVEIIIWEVPKENWGSKGELCG